MLNTLEYFHYAIQPRNAKSAGICAKAHFLGLNHQKTMFKSMVFKKKAFLWSLCIGYSVQNMLENKYGKFPLDLEECKKSNIMISGTNSTGKSRLAMSISERLMAEGWQILVFDSSGIWKRKSSIPYYFQVSEVSMSYILPKSESMIFDISLLLPSYQREFLEAILNDIWLDRVKNPRDQWLLIVLEEAQLYMRNIKGLVSQSLMRMCSVGRNQKIRVLAISPSHVGLDTEFRRLAQQRYIFRIGNESNTRRRFSSVYSRDWYRVCKELDTGFCLYYLNEKMQVWRIPLFQSSNKPKQVVDPKPKSFIHKIITAISGNEENEEPYIGQDPEGDTDAIIEDEDLIEEDLFEDD